MKNIFVEIRSFFYLLPKIFSAFFSKPETIGYPQNTSAVSSIYRGSVQVHAENCTGCSLCVRQCPSSALELEKESRKSYTLIHYRDRCIYCGQCERSCKFDAIYISTAYTPPSDDRDRYRVILVERKEDGAE